MNIFFDVWEGQLEIDEAAMQGHIKGLVIRLNDINGGHHLDTNFTKQWAESTAFYRAPYFVYNPWKSGMDNFAWLIANCPETKILFIDVEVGRALYSATAYAKDFNDFYQRAKAAFSKVVIYTAEWFVPYLAYWPAGAEYWWAQYLYAVYPKSAVQVTWDALNSLLTTLPATPTNAVKCPGPIVLWQCSGDRLQPPGTERPIDVNLWLKSDAEIDRYFIKPDAIPEPSPLPIVTIVEVTPQPSGPITIVGKVQQGDVMTGFEQVYTPPVAPPPTPSPTPTPAPTYPPDTYLLPIGLWSGTHGGATSPAPGPWTQPLTFSPPKADNHFNLSDRWLNYIRRWNTQADYDRIISPDFGPFAANGAYIALGYPGDNIVHILEIRFIQGQDWGRIESIDTGQAPPVNVAPITHPWLFHAVRGADSAGKKWFDIGDYVIPLLSAPGKALWLPMKALVKL